MFRVFLELSIKHFIKEKLRDSAKKNLALYENIQKVSDYMKRKKILNEEQLKPVDTLTSRDNRHSIFSTDTLNSYVHNLYYIPPSNDLKISWNNVEIFIQKLWE